MKKIVLGFFILLSSFVLIFTGVKTKAVSAPVMVSGASIRATGEHQGLKFSATVDSLEGVTEHGFYVALGTHTKDAIQTAVESSATSVGGKKLKKIVVNGSDLTFHGVIYNIPASSYDKTITALAYVFDGSSYVFASTSQSRNILEVAQAAVADPNYEQTSFIDRICNTSTFNLNGGQLTYDYQFTITKSGNFGENVASGYFITCGTKANYDKCCNGYWSRIYIEKTDVKGLYQVIAAGNYDGDYDYVIAAHGSCYDTVSRSAINAILGNISNMSDYYVSFTAPTTTNCNIVVNVDRNIDKLFGNNIYYSQGETLLTSVKKDYYTFAGWYDNISLTGDAIATHASNSAVTYYAKWTPVEYTLSFDLQGGRVSGETSKDDIIFTYESDEIILPAANLMTRTDYTFVGWYDNASGVGEAITSIPAHSHSNITVYAVWEADIVNELSINSADTTVLTAIDADIIVKSGLDGKYSIDITKYDGVVFNTAGGNAFTTLAAALDYLDANSLTNKKIYVFAGSYSGAANITQSGTVIYGPNYNINGYDSRNAEASITGLVTITGASSIINGLGFTSDGAIKVGANFVTISYVHMQGVTTVECNGNNRKGCIVDSKDISNLTVNNSYINAPGSSNSYTNQFMSFTRVTTFTMRDNYITNEATTLSGSYAGMLIYNIGGIVNISGNTFAYATNGYIFRLGGYGTNSASIINISDNIFSGRDSYNNATIAIQNGKSTINIMNNQFKSFAPGTFNLSGDTGSNVYVIGNYFDSNKVYKVGTKGSANFVFDNNYFEGGIDGADVSGAASSGNRFENKSNYDTFRQGIVVDISKTGTENGTIVSYGGKNFVYGTNLFDNISSAISSASNWENIYVMPGTYSGPVSISKPVNLIGPNCDTLPTGSPRENSEAIITGVMTLQNGVKNTTINGFKFTGDGQVYAVSAVPESPIYENSDFKFIYNYVDKGTNTTPVIYFANADKVYTNNMLIDHCYFTSNDTAFEPNAGEYGIVFIYNTNNLFITNSKFENISKYAIGVYDTASTSGARGDIYVENCVFKNISISALWFDYYGRADANSKILIKNNWFEDVNTEKINDKAAIDLENTNGNAYNSIRIECNVFKHVSYCLWTGKSAGNTFTNNVVFKYDGSTNTIVARGTSGKSIDCGSNLYLDYDGNPVFIEVQNKNGFSFNANVTNVDTSNYASVDAYNTATGQSFSLGD